MEIKNKDLQQILSIILFYTNETVDGKTVSIEAGGLLKEEITLGLKRHLQKIRKECLDHHETLKKDYQEISEVIIKKAIETLPSEISEKQYRDEKSEHYAKFQEVLETFTEEFNKEINDLQDESIKLNSQPASLEMIMKINTKANYDFDIIEKFAQ